PSSRVAGCHTFACCAVFNTGKPAPVRRSTVAIRAFHIGTTGVPALVRFVVLKIFVPTCISIESCLGGSGTGGTDGVLLQAIDAWQNTTTPSCIILFTFFIMLINYIYSYLLIFQMANTVIIVLDFQLYLSGVFPGLAVRQMLPARYRIP